jgi:hypothetical protein
MPGEDPAVTGPTVCAPELAIVTVSPDIGSPFRSVTVAVTVEVELPSAVIDDGERETATSAAGAE